MSSVVAWRNIGELVTCDASHGTGPLGAVTDAAVVSVDGRIAWVGPSTQCPDADTTHDMDGCCVLPGFVDSHTHPIFGGDRSSEFAARMAGDSYEAGGIRATVAATRATSDEVLRERAAKLRDEALGQGTTTLEAKSGYGLTVHDECRSLQAACSITSETTFLGAHVVPQEFAHNPDAYVSLVIGDMLEQSLPYAKWADVFCDRGAFDVDQARHILTACSARGLGLRLHANQLQPGPGVQLGVELKAASVDHCTYLSNEDLAALAGSRTIATFVPGAEFSTRAPYPNIRRALDAGVTVALASDCNPGTSYTTSLPFAIALAVRDMGMTPAEAVWASTAGGAAALQRDDIGIIAPGARADLQSLAAANHIHLAYRPGVPLTTGVWVAGQRMR
ncbi:MAG: imidazolonepropionase [Candidatus Nanopelagicales bacterium]